MIIKINTTLQGVLFIPRSLCLKSRALPIYPVTFSQAGRQAGRDSETAVHNIKLILIVHKWPLDVGKPSYRKKMKSQTNKNK